MAVNPVKTATCKLVRIKIKCMDKIGRGGFVKSMESISQNLERYDN